MRACPFCAEPIQDAAILCKHCGKDVPVYMPPPAPNTSTKEVSTAGKVLVAVLAVVVLVFVVSTLTAPEAQTPRKTADPRSLLARPHLIDIVPSAEIDVAAGALYRYEWEVPDDQPMCHITGRVEVLSGGNKDVEVFIVNDDEYQNLANGHKFRAFDRTDPTTVHVLNVRADQAGKMVLVVSNRFSVVTSKRVRFSNVRATCT